MLDPFYVLHDNDWVQILALDQQQRVLVVEQYRYAGDTFCLELPGGIIDPDEDSLKAAQRELLEETGAVSGEWEYVGWMFANPARQINRIQLFVARNVQLSRPQELDDSEDIKFQFLPKNGVHERIEAGIFCHALHIAGYFRCLAHIDA